MKSAGFSTGILEFVNLLPSTLIRSSKSSTSTFLVGEADGIKILQESFNWNPGKKMKQMALFINFL